jgi:hypothetical protein
MGGPYVPPDHDSFGFSLPNGTRLTSITYTWNTIYSGGVSSAGATFYLENNSGTFLGGPERVEIISAGAAGSTAMFVFHETGLSSSGGWQPEWTAQYRIDFEVAGEVLTPVPEPGILVLLGISMMSVVGLKRWWRE